MVLYVVRHGETEANAKHILQGEAINGSLTENGRQQVQNTVPKIPSDIQALFVSPLKRVLESAEILNQNLSLELIVRDELKERNFGSFAGHSFDEIENGKELKEIDERLEYNYRPQGGESVRDVEVRLDTFIEELKILGHEKVLTVTSRGPVRQFYKILESRLQPNIPNGSLHSFEI